MVVQMSAKLNPIVVRNNTNNTNNHLMTQSDNKSATSGFNMGKRNSTSSQQSSQMLGLM